MRLVDRIAYINHDIDDALRAGVLAPGRPAGGRDRGARATPARSASTRSCTTSSSTPSAAGDIVQGAEVGAAMLRLRAFMFERVYLGPTGARRARGDRARASRRCSTATASTRTSCPTAAVRRRRRGRARDRLPRRDDRPLRDPGFEELTVPQASGVSATLMARYTDDSRERVRDAVDFVELVGARTELRRAGPRRITGAVPVPRRAHAVVRHRPGREALPLLRLRRGRRRLQVRAWRRRGSTSASALELLAERYGVAARAREEDPRDAERRRRRERLLALLERTAAYYVRVLWESDEAAAAREYLLSRGLEEAYAARVPRRLLAERVGPRADRPRGAPASASASCCDAGSRAARRDGAALRPLPRPDHVPAGRRARARARLRRARDRRRPAAEVPQHVGVRGLPQGPPALRRRPRARSGRARPAASCSSRATPT